MKHLTSWLPNLTKRRRRIKQSAVDRNLKRRSRWSESNRNANKGNGKRGTIFTWLADFIRRQTRYNDQLLTETQREKAERITRRNTNKRPRMGKILIMILRFNPSWKLCKKKVWKKVRTEHKEVQGKEREGKQFWPWFSDLIKRVITRRSTSLGKGNNFHGRQWVKFAVCGLCVRVRSECGRKSRRSKVAQEVENERREREGGCGCPALLLYRES